MCLRRCWWHCRWKGLLPPTGVKILPSSGSQHEHLVTRSTIVFSPPTKLTDRVFLVVASRNSVTPSGNSVGPSLQPPSAYQWPALPRDKLGERTTSTSIRRPFTRSSAYRVRLIGEATSASETWRQSPFLALGARCCTLRPDVSKQWSLSYGPIAPPRKALLFYWQNPISGCGIRKDRFLCDSKAQVLLLWRVQG